MLILSIPLFAYPRHLPKFHKYKMERQKASVGQNKVDNEYGNSITDFPKAAKELISNKPYIFTILAATSEALVTNGFAVFLPKFIQSQFSITASGASFISGIVVVPGAGGGMILVNIITISTDVSVLNFDYHLLNIPFIIMIMIRDKEIYFVLIHFNYNQDNRLISIIIQYFRVVSL